MEHWKNDRNAIQSEINQLTLEVDRIADTTQFNQKKLFSGSEQGRAFAEINSDQISPNPDVKGEWKGVVTAEPSEKASVELVFSEEVGALTDDDPSNIEGKTFVINGKTYEVVTSNTPLNGNIAVKVDWSEPTGDGAIEGNINKLMIGIKEAVEKNDPTFSMSDII